MAIGWAIANILRAGRQPTNMYLERDPQDPTKFIELVPKKECSLRKGETGIVIQT